MKDHHKGLPTAMSFGRQVPDYVAVAEAALGKRLPFGAVVHHLDEDHANPSPTNLVVCPSQSYHRLLHKRADAMKACGNANFEKCPYCQVWDDPTKMSFTQKRSHKVKNYWHNECRNEYRRNHYAKTHVSAHG